MRSQAKVAKICQMSKFMARGDGFDDSRNETAEEAGLYSRSYLVVPRNDNLSPRGPKVGSATLLLMRSS